MKRLLVVIAVAVLMLAGCGESLPDNAYVDSTACADESVNDYGYLPEMRYNYQSKRYENNLRYQIVGSHIENRCRDHYVTPTPSPLKPEGY